MNPYSVILRPVLSEKSDQMRENQHKYTFIIAKKATKTDVKSALEKMFDVKVRAVTTCITRGKMRRKGQHIALRQSRKKAVVSLHAGFKLDIFDN